MRQIILLFCGITIFLVAMVPEAKAQVTMSATATAEVIEALSTKETSQLNFGRFSPKAQGGKIILTPEGTISVQGNVVLEGGTQNAASFSITGQYDATFSISLPLGPETLINFKNDKTIQVSDWKSSPAQGIGAGILTSGELTVRIGASLTVGDMNANPVGIYSGSYAVTFGYN